MAVDKFGNWDGVCACGKREFDGIRCRFGGTHLRTFSDGIGAPKAPERVRERLPEPEPPRKRERLPPRKRERLDLFDD